MATATLIQPSEIIQGGLARQTPTDIRFDASLVSPHIRDAEARWVVPVLTEAFYEVLAAEKGTSSAFSTVAYQELWDTHLKQYCAFACLYEAAPFVVMQMGSNGLYLNSNEYGQTAGQEGLKFWHDELAERLERKRDRLFAYLCSCAAALTGFDSSGAGCQDPDCNTEDYSDFDKVLGVFLY